jgi:hypothetical protein
MSQGTITYTASGTTTSVSTNARRTGSQPTVNVAIAVMPMATRGKIASQVSAART